ncbi:MAG: CsbD family protein [Gaiellaceae bacterium]
MSAKLDKANGKAKEKAGQATGNKSLEGKGHLEQAKGKAKDALHEAKEAADDLI